MLFNGLELPLDQGYDLDFLTEEGAIHLLGTRRLMFPAEAFGDMRNELIKSLGKEIARQVIFRFGYQCGARDSATIRELVEKRDNGILLGPFFHQVQGIVLAKNKSLAFNEEGTLLVMEGEWINSYEAVQHLRHYGLANEPVCWSLAGYATGYASRVLNEDLLCLETSCVAQGDEVCTYEIRPATFWPQEVRQQWLSNHQPLHIEKNLANLLAEERQRNYRQQIFSDGLVQIGEQNDSQALLRKLIYYVHRMVNANNTALFRIDQDGETETSLVLEDTLGDIACTIDIAKLRHVAGKANYFGELFVENDLNEQGAAVQCLIAVPVIADKKPTHIIVVATEEKMTFESSEALKVYIGYCGILLEKLLVKQELTGLIEKEVQLKEELEYSLQQKKELTAFIDISKEFINFMLEGKGVTAFIQELGEVTQSYVIVIDESGQIFGRNLEKKRAEELVQRYYQKAFQTGRRYFQFPLLAGEKKLGRMLVVERHFQLGEKEKMLLEAGAKIIALEVLKEQEAQLQYRFNFFELLLSGEYSSRDVLVTQANKVNFLLDGTYQMVGIALEKPGNEGTSYINDGSLFDTLYHQARNFVKDKSANSKVLIFSQQIIIFLSYADKEWSKKELEVFFSQLMHQLKKHFPKYGVYLVCGRICKILSHYPMAYREIKACLTIMKRLKQMDRVIYFEKLGVLSILFEVEQSKLVDFVDSVLGPLIDFDEGAGQELLPTLSLYVKNNFNIQVTARNHYISASTLKYRLRKIKDLGIDLEDPEVRLNIQLALKLTEYQ
jgi:sugar diacid utilization regulator/predicted hydrocarbon binding protein